MLINTYKSLSTEYMKTIRSELYGIQLTTSFSGELILYYLSNIIYTNSIVLIAMYNYIDDCC